MKAALEGIEVSLELQVELQRRGGPRCKSRSVSLRRSAMRLKRAMCAGVGDLDGRDKKSATSQCGTSLRVNVWSMPVTPLEPERYSDLPIDTPSGAGAPGGCR